MLLYTYFAAPKFVFYLYLYYLCNQNTAANLESKVKKPQWGRGATLWNY